MSAPIDIAHIEQYVGGDRALLDEILSIFEDQALALIDRLDPFMDIDEWTHIAHKLKGGARGVGAWAVGDLAEEAERRGASAAPDRASLLERLAPATHAAVNYARALRDGRGPGD